MKLFTLFLLGFLSIQSFCPMQIGMALIDHHESSTSEEDCPTAHCISHEDKTDDVELSISSPVLPAIRLVVLPLPVFPNPAFEPQTLHAPPSLSLVTKTIVLRL